MRHCLRGLVLTLIVSAVSFAGAFAQDDEDESGFELLQRAARSQVEMAESLPAVGVTVVKDAFATVEGKTVRNVREEHSCLFHGDLFHTRMVSYDIRLSDPNYERLTQTLYDGESFYKYWEIPGHDAHSPPTRIVFEDPSFQSSFDPNFLYHPLRFVLNSADMPFDELVENAMSDIPMVQPAHLDDGKTIVVRVTLGEEIILYTIDSELAFHITKIASTDMASGEVRYERAVDYVWVGEYLLPRRVSEMSASAAGRVSKDFYEYKDYEIGVSVSDDAFTVGALDLPYGTRYIETFGGKAPIKTSYVGIETVEEPEAPEDLKNEESDPGPERAVDPSFEFPDSLTSSSLSMELFPPDFDISSRIAVDEETLPIIEAELAPPDSDVPLEPDDAAGKEGWPLRLIVTLACIAILIICAYAWEKYRQRK